VTTVDDYIEANVLPEQRETVAMLRSLVREVAPQAQEVFSYNMPVFKARGIIAWILATKKDITFSFTYGARFEDHHGLLRGKGKHARHVKLKAVDSVDRAVLRDYLEQALALDAG
jgi:hypothetical protein